MHLMCRLKNGNNLWEQGVKTELKQLTHHQTFILLDSGEIIPTDYQKVPYHVVFDVKYDLRYKVRLGIVNENEDILSGVARIDTMRIGFFLG
jgi:hypothetical protein